MNKELSNDQRARLEQIARDEFGIKQREISAKKQNEFNNWVKAQCEKTKKGSLAKHYLKLTNELAATRKKLNSLGFSITNANANYIEVNMISAYYGGDPKPSAEYTKRKNASMISHDVFTRGLNKVLAVIWSMEKPFSACIKLIEAEVKRIR